MYKCVLLGWIGKFVILIQLKTFIAIRKEGSTMKHAASTFNIILSMILLCTICLVISLNAYAYYAAPVNIFEMPLLYSGLSGYGTYNPFAPSLQIPAMYRILQANMDNTVLQSNPAKDILDLFWNFSEFPANSFGLGSDLSAIDVSNQSYVSMPYLLNGFPFTGLTGISLPGMGFSALGFPGMGFPGFGFPGMGFPGVGLLGMGFPAIGFPGTGFPAIGFPAMGFPGLGFPGLGSEGLGLPGIDFAGIEAPQIGFDLQGSVLGQQQTSEVTGSPLTDPLLTLLDPFENLISELLIGDLPDALSAIIPELPIVPSLFDVYIPLANLNSRMYKTAKLEGVRQIIYIIIMDNGASPDLTIEEILNNGLYCIKVENAPGIKSSYTMEFGEQSYTLSLYLEINTRNFIWAWNNKWW